MKYDFVWDGEKNKANINEHNLSFELASKVFFDPNRFENYDLIHSEDVADDRYFSVGFIQSAPIYVTYVYVKESHTLTIIRIISARRAEEDEVEEYFKHQVRRPQLV